MKVFEMSTVNFKSKYYSFEVPINFILMKKYRNMDYGIKGGISLDIIHLTSSKYAGEIILINPDSSYFGWGAEANYDFNNYLNFGLNFGIFVKPSKRISLGLNYHHILKPYESQSYYFWVSNVTLGIKEEYPVIVKPKMAYLSFSVVYTFLNRKTLKDYKRDLDNEKSK